MATKKISKKDAALLAQLRASGLHAEAAAFESKLMASTPRRAKSHSLKKGDILSAAWSAFGAQGVDFFQVTSVEGNGIWMAEIGARQIGKSSSCLVLMPSVGDFLEESKKYEADGDAVVVDIRRTAIKWDGNPYVF